MGTGIRTDEAGCGLCHRAESATPDARGGFSSVAFQPLANELVALETVRTIPAAVCSGNDDASPPCVFWHALFDYGEVRAGAFAANVDTITH